MIQSLTPVEVAARDDLWILDVREPHEWDYVHVSGSHHIPLGSLSQRLGHLPKDQPIACLCHHGIRSHHAASMIASAGFTEVYNICGGIDRWAIEVDPEVGRY
jgi:rhodanese-related sulfurtransferase